MLDGQYKMKPHEGKKYSFSRVEGITLTQRGPDPKTFYEGEFNREVAWRLINMLLNMLPQGSEVEIHDVVAQRQITERVTFEDLEQENVKLGIRSRYANKHTKDSILLSIHANAAGSREVLSQGRGHDGASGIIIFTRGGEDSSDHPADSMWKAFNSTPTGLEVWDRSKSKHSAVARWKTIDCTPLFEADGVTPQLDRKGRQKEKCKEFDPKYLQATQTYKHDYEANFWMLGVPRCAAVLGETGFFTNLKDAKILASSNGQDMIALAYFKGLIPHLDFSAPAIADMPSTGSMYDGPA
jgi:N-acetylmuramoyl-L-alanine amidase